MKRQGKHKMNDDYLNNISAFLKRSFDILFVLNPERSSLGVLFGLVLHTIMEVFRPFLITLSDTIDFSNIGEFELIIFSVFLFNCHSLIKPRKLPRDIEMALDFIKVAEEKGNLPRIHIRQMYINLFKKVIEKVDLNEEIRKQVQ